MGQHPKVSYPYIAKLFLKTGAISFGGWSSTALILEKELVETEGSIAKHQLQGAVTYAQIIPGGTQTAIVSNVGFQLRGFKGSVVAILFYLIPALSLILAFAIIYFHFLSHSSALNHLGGLRAALAGAILANAMRIGKQHASRSWMWLVIIGAILAKLSVGINAAIVVIILGVCGIIFSVTGLGSKKRD